MELTSVLNCFGVQKALVIEIQNRTVLNLYLYISNHHSHIFESGMIGTLME